jgi:outer membrane lipoprotein SlyB
MKFTRHVLCAAALCAVTLAQAQTAAPAAPAAPAPSARQLAALCDTCALVTATKVEKRKGKASGAGAVGGAVVGGVVGNKVGDGGTVSTGVGAVAGGLLGNEIEKRVKRRKVWVTTVVGRDGKPQTFESDTDPALKIGEAVRIEGGKLVKATARQ